MSKVENPNLEKKELLTISPLLGERKATIADIKEWNKNKFFPLSVINISITDKGVTHNAEELEKAVESICKEVTEKADNALDSEMLDTLASDVKAVGEWIYNTRRIQTDPLKSIEKNYSKVEKKLYMKDTKSPSYQDSLYAYVKNRKAIVMEKHYKKNQEAIEAEIKELLAQNDVVLDVSKFGDFVSKKRVLKDFYLSDGSLNAKIKGEIAKAVEDEVRPILEEREKALKKEKEIKQFNLMLDNANTVEELERLKLNSKEVFEVISHDILTQIDFKIEKVKNALAVQAQMEEEEKLKEQQEKLNEEILSIIEPTVEEISPFEFDSEPTNLIKAQIRMEDLEPLTYMVFDGQTEEEIKNKMIQAFENHLSMVKLNIVTGE